MASIGVSPLHEAEGALGPPSVAAIGGPSAAPTRWQVALPLLAALAVLFRHVHRRVRSHAPPRPNDDAEARGRFRSEEKTAPLLATEGASETRRRLSSRFVPLDVLRGVTICLMVFVNYGGGGMAAFTHSVWDGLTVADVLFPWFAWMMGFSVALASAARRTPRPSASQRRAKLRDAAARALRLFLLGVFLNNGSSWRHWRIPGVLQALAAAFSVVAAADLALAAVVGSASARPTVRALLVPHVALVAAPLVALNLAVTFALPVPGCPTGYIGPGGNASVAEDPKIRGGPLANCTGGAHLLVDVAVFGRDHIYQTPTCQQTYATGPFDPEGLLNWLMVAATAHVGYCVALAALGIDSGDPHQAFLRRVRRVVAGSGATLVATGLLLTQWPGVPINKNLWSLPFVLVSSGLAAFALALAAVVVDKTERLASASASASASLLVGRRWAWAYARYPWVFVGTNPIAIYAMSYAPFSPKTMHGGEERVPRLELALFNLVGVAWWIHVAAWLHQRGVFIKI